MLQRRIDSGPATTPAPSVIPGLDGAIACCDSDKPVCTIQPTACVDNYLHPASVLCTGNCPNDDMTLKCTSGMNSQCRLAHVATPIAYFGRPSYEGDSMRRREELNPGRLATLNQVVRGWYCAQLETNTDIVSQYMEVSTLGQGKAVTESVATETTSSGATATSETQPAENHDGNSLPQPSPQPGSSLDDPSSPIDSPLFDAGQNQTDFPGGEDCDWIDEYGNCCDPSEGGYYRPKRQRQVRRSHSEEAQVEQASISTISTLQIVTYIQSTTITSRPMTSFTPAEGPEMPIIEAIYIVFDTYENRTNPIHFQEATRSHTILLYTDTLERSSDTPQPTRSHPGRPTNSNQGDSRAGMKAGIAIGSIVVVALVVFVVCRCRSRRKAKRVILERDAQPGPTRGWST